MNKFQLLNKLTENLRSGGFKTEVIFEESKSNPLFVVLKDKEKIFVTICEVGIKPAKYKDIVFCGISPKIQNNIEVEKTHVVIIDFQPIKPKYILVKLNDTNHRRNKTDYIIFDFKRPDYGGFYNIEQVGELFKQIQNEIDRT